MNSQDIRWLQRKINKLQSKLTKVESERRSLKKQLAQERQKKSRAQRDVHLQ